MCGLINGSTSKSRNRSTKLRYKVSYSYGIQRKGIETITQHELVSYKVLFHAKSPA